MQKNKKARTQGAGKEENRADDIKSETSQASGIEDSANTGVAAQTQNDTTNEGIEVTADNTTTKSVKKGKATASGAKKTTNKPAVEAAGNAGSAPLKKSSKGTSKKNTPGLPAANGIAQTDRDAIIAAVDADAERQTGRPTGAIYGSGGDIIAVQNPAGAAQATQTTGAVEYAKAYGLIQASENNVYLTQGSVPEGQLQLLGQEGNQEFFGQLSGYQDQFVTVLGEYQSQGDGNSSAFVVRSIASHNEIAQRAYELSESGDNSPEDNWIRAENELLQR